VPGPGTYKLPNSLGGPGFSLRGWEAKDYDRKDRGELGSGPVSPGYELAGRKWSFTGRPRSAPASSKAHKNPGPGEYSIPSSLGGGAVRFGRPAKPKPRKDDSSPGVGAYGVPDVPKTNLGPTFGKRLEIPKKTFDSPMYGTSSTTNRDTGYTIQRRRKHGSMYATRMNDVPGPGHYPLPGTTQTEGPGGYMGRKPGPVKRPKSAPPKPYGPGPQHYRLKSTVGELATGGYKPWGAAPRFVDPRRQQTPGASLITKTVPSEGGRMKPWVGVTPSRPRSAPPGYVRSEPQMLTLPSTLTGGGWSFGTGKRPPLNAGVGTESPGPTVGRPSSLGGRSCGIHGREAWKDEKIAQREFPGPGHYRQYTNFGY
jgi:hypothetical protein